MPWKRPSSQPTSWAWAIRSSASDGVASSVNGSESRSSSSTSSGASPLSSSLIEERWISLSRLRLASSSGADFTSSRSCRIMLPIRITFAGCSTRSERLPRSSPSSSEPPTALLTASAGTATGCPSGPTTITCCCPDCCSLMPGSPRNGERSEVLRGVCSYRHPTNVAERSDDQQDLSGALAALHQPMGRGRLGQRERPSDHRPDGAFGDQGPDVLDDGRADGRLLADRPGPQGGPDHGCALAHQR